MFTLMFLIVLGLMMFPIILIGGAIALRLFLILLPIALGIGVIILIVYGIVVLIQKIFKSDSKCDKSRNLGESRNPHMTTNPVHPSKDAPDEKMS